MAWNIHWQCLFKSLGGTQYAVNIYEQNYSGNIVQLTGASEPFVTQEDDDDDIFIPIRSQTGYLRVIDTDGTLLESIIPSNNLQKLVRLYEGHISSGDFVADNIMWQGFLCADAYTQPWDGDVKVIEVPLKSLLAAMEDIFLPESYLGDEINIAKVFVDAYNALGETPTGVYVINNLDNAETDFLKVRVEMAAFFKEETIVNEGDSHIEYVGESFYETLSNIIKLYGLMVREYSGKLYIVMFDNSAGKIGFLQIPQWSDFEDIADGNVYGGSMIAVPESSLLDYVDFAGINNTAGFVLGGKQAKVVVNLGGLTFGISLPFTEETSDTPIELQLNSGKLYVQPHAPRSQYEGFYYIEYNKDQYVAYSNYQSMLQKTIINGYVPNPYALTGYNLWTGAFPIRWFRQTDTEQVVLKNGLYMNTQYKTGATNPSNITPTPDFYSINSKLKLRAVDGWIRINFEFHDIIWAQLQSQYGEYYMDDASQAFAQDVETELKVSLVIGDKVWNGNGWEYGRPSTAYFTIFFTNGKINTNKTPSMNIAEDDGYFIPITETMDGDVTLCLWNFSTVKTADGTYRYCYSHILSDLEVSHIRPISIVASQRSANTYIKSILSNGFSEEKIIETNIGTINNNIPSTCFLKRTISEYIQLLTYYYEVIIPPYTQTTTKTIRPEMNLLERIVAQFSQLRRTFIAVMHNPTNQNYNFFQMRFTYLEKKFFGLLKKNSWRDDTQEVKFIEVT